MRMIGLITGALLCAQGAFAQCAGRDLLADAPAPLLEELDRLAAEWKHGEGRLWAVTKGDRRSILFGTFHIPDPAIAIIPDSLRRELDGAREVFVEATSEELMRMQLAMAERPDMILNQSGQALRPYFNQTEWEVLLEALKPFGLTARSAEELAPWFTTLTLGMPPCVLYATIRGEQAMDQKIEAAARERDVPVTGLETWEVSLRALNQGSFAEQAEMLRLSLPMIESAADGMATVTALYEAGEIAKIWEFGRIKGREVMPPEMVDEELARFYDAIVGDRNRAWMARLIPALERGGAVVAVGALHLGGRDGLLTLLETRGWQVERLE